MAIYSASFTAVAVSAAQDVFEIVAPSNSRVFIREIRLAQYSDFGDAQAEILSVLVKRGATVTGSGGSAVTPVNLAGHTGAATAASTVAANNTTPAGTGTIVTLISDAWNVSAGWFYTPKRSEAISLKKSQRLVVSITAPADAITLNGTLIFEEAGYGAEPFGTGNTW